MRELVGAIGLGALLCLPCLLVGGGVLAVASGGAITALTGNPLTQLLGLMVLAGGALIAVRAWRRRGQSCAECELRGGDHAGHLRHVSSEPRRVK